MFSVLLKRPVAATTKTNGGSTGKTRRPGGRLASPTPRKLPNTFKINIKIVPKPQNPQGQDPQILEIHLAPSTTATPPAFANRKSRKKNETSPALFPAPLPPVAPVAPVATGPGRRRSLLRRRQSLLRRRRSAPLPGPGERGWRALLKGAAGTPRHDDDNDNGDDNDDDEP